jgi:cobalt-zinc-cadmium efflux system membrane fusion protein
MNKVFIVVILLIFSLMGCQDQSPKAPLGQTPQEHSHEKKEHSENGSDHSEHEEEEGHLELSPERRRSLKIETQPVVLAGGQSTGLRPGVIGVNPDHQVVITSQAAGTLKQVYARVGSYVAEGRPIVLISSPEVTAMQSEFHEAEVEAKLARRELSNKRELLKVGDDIRRPQETAQLEMVKAEAQVQAVSAKLKSAVLKNERLEALLKEGIASRQQVEESRAERQSLEAELRQAKVALKIAQDHLQREKQIASSGLKVKAETFPAEARLARAEEKMNHSREKLLQLGASPQGHQGLVTLNSPISGTVVERSHARGSLVEVGEQVALVVDAKEVWAWVDLQRSDLEIVQVGDPINLTLVDNEQVRAEGFVDYISPNISEKTQTLRARVILSDPPQGFSLGSFVNARLKSGSGSKQPAIPEEAVQFVESQTVVYLQTDEGFERTPIAVGPPANGGLVTVKGLKVGQKIAVAGVEQLKSLDLADEIGGHSH